ncbi:MAG: MFS transporter, partial [Klebsiella variicola]|nr:MFS transporter [Klebsiella variicola]
AIYLPRSLHVTAQSKQADQQYPDNSLTLRRASNWIANMIVGATFLTMLNSLGSANTFWVYGGLNVLFILLTIWLIPETKNVSLEHIERNLMQGRPLREIGARD